MGTSGSLIMTLRCAVCEWWSSTEVDVPATTVLLEPLVDGDPSLLSNLLVPSAGAFRYFHVHMTAMAKPANAPIEVAFWSNHDILSSEVYLI